MGDSAKDIARLALLDEPTRRRLYEFVRSKDHAVGRDEAAAKAKISRGLAAFHLDRLAEAGLLETEYRRISGRTGRGAGRPAKLYRPGRGSVAVSVPPTRYDLVGSVLAAAAEETAGAREAVRRAAFARGLELGRDLGGARKNGGAIRRAEHALAELGFEAQVGDGMVRLRNCPFSALVQRSRDVVCGLNLALVTGVLAGLNLPGLVAEPDPEPTRCCVRVRSSEGAGWETAPPVGP